MKNVLPALALCVSFSGFGQVLNVASVNKVPITPNPNAKVAAISPQGDYLLITSATNAGLAKFDLSTNESKTITNAKGAGFDVKISQDGNNVVFRQDTYTANHLRMVQLNSYDLTTNSEVNLVAPSRDLQGYAVEGKTVAAINKGKVAARTTSNAKAKTSTPVLSINNRQLMITRDGKTSVFSPNGKNLSYIWPSISPDGTKALYFVCGVGAFVCDLDGNNVKELGLIRAPQWYNDNVVIGMNDTDDGEFIISSSIVATTLDGTKQTLTDDSVVAMYPYASKDGNKIAFSTPAGEAYIINISK